MSEQDKTAPIARGWWRAHCRPTDDTSNARATRAKLRRAHDWREAMQVPAAPLLVAQLGLTNGNDERIEAALDLARVLAHVKDDSGTPLMRAVGYLTTPRKGNLGNEQPRLAVQRFNRLLRTNREELPLSLIRLVRLSDEKANIAELSKAMLGWSVEWKKDRLCRDWAFDYYAASIAKPADDPPPQSNESTDEFLTEDQSS